MNNLLYCKDYLVGSLRYYIKPYLPIYNFSINQIDNFVFIGDLNSALNIDYLQEKEIKNIVNTILAIDDIYPDSFNYCNLELRDSYDENIIKDFDKASDFINNCVENNEKVLVHCAYGISRSASIVIAYYMKYHKMSYNSAYAYVKSKRKNIEPNENFKQQLDIYQQQLNLEKIQ